MQLLDANVMMEAANRYYAFDLAPTFWQWVVGAHQAGQIASTQAIREEIVSGRGALTSWAEQVPPTFWLPDTAGSLAEVRRLAAWAAHPDRGYRQDAVAAFMGSGDIRLVAVAAAGGHDVVTHEQSRPDSVKRIMIPDASTAVGVRCLSPFECFRNGGLRL